MNIVHLTNTALAGAPYRLVDSLKNLTDYNVDLIQLIGSGNIYNDEKLYKDNIDESVNLLENSDIIHFHNYLPSINSNNNIFGYNDLNLKGKNIVIQFHSSPWKVADILQVDKNEILNTQHPSLVIGQFQERYYPNAMVVKNLIPVNSDEYKPVEKSTDETWDIFFSATTNTFSWRKRWETKGLPETAAILKTLKILKGLSIQIPNKISLKDLLILKRKSKIVIDDVVTGSYHLSGLEGLSLGKPVFSYLDQRTEYIIRFISGSNDNPFINVQLTDLYSSINKLFQEPEQIKEIGILSRNWIEKYWSEKSIVNSYVEMYKKLLENPNLIKRQVEIDINKKSQRYLHVQIPDITRKKSHNVNLLIRLISFMIFLFNKLRNR